MVALGSAKDGGVYIFLYPTSRSSWLGKVKLSRIGAVLILWIKFSRTLGFSDLGIPMHYGTQTCISVFV